jgi:hypothetical protein
MIKSHGAIEFEVTMIEYPGLWRFAILQAIFGYLYL